LKDEPLSPIPGPESGRDRGKRSSRGRLREWIDQRTGIDEVLQESLDERIPGGARLAYVFGSGLLFIFVSQIVTGLCLALYYVPSPMSAHVSVAYIDKEVAAGSFLRSLHSYGSSAMVVVLALHFLQTFLYGSYKGKRELLWISGCILSLLVLGMAFTGTLLSWDQKAYFAGSVGTALVGQVPIIGESFRLLLRGGPSMGALTISRFYVLHVFVIPFLVFSLVAIHMVLFRRAGPAGPPSEDPIAPRMPAETFYPKQVVMDMAFVLVVMGVLGLLAHFVPVRLGPVANPTDSRYLPRPEWYFLPMFQWLKYWEGWRTVIGIVVIPVVLIGLVFLLPFLDRGLERRPWRRAIPVGAVLIVLTGIVGLGVASRLDDARDPSVAAQIGEQNQEEKAFASAAFQPYSASLVSEGVAPPPSDASGGVGRGIFDSRGCAGCHGEKGIGGRGPSLTGVSGKYGPTELAALLERPTAKMKAGGMVPLTMDAAGMSALVSYLVGLGPNGAGSGPTYQLSGPARPGPGEAEPTLNGEMPKSRAGMPAVSEVVGNGKAPKGSPGEGIYQSSGCVACHGEAGRGTTRAPSLRNLDPHFAAGTMASLLRNPTAKMRNGGMAPVTLSDHDLTSLVAYLTSLSPAATTEPQGKAQVAKKEDVEEHSASLPVTTVAEPTQVASQLQRPGEAAGANPASQEGEAVFNAQGCASCHGAGGIGSNRAPALAATSQTMTAFALASVLQHPSSKMRSGGMSPVSLNATDMSALVGYLQSLATRPTAPAAVGTAAAGASPSSGEVVASQQPAKIMSLPPMTENESRGEVIFKARGCAGCHGTNGVAGTAAAPPLAGTGVALAPALLTTMLEHPTARMQHGGMPPVSLSGDELKALVAYIARVSATKLVP
jgi:ubiquinol-cytochrome c reductase cytochrome b subunit